MEKTKNITNEVVTNYINTLYKPLNDKLKDLRKYGEENNIPIILSETEMFLKSILSLIKPKRILEIGTAIGYSSIFFKEYLKDVEIVSIEKDEEIAKLAISNINYFGYSDSISIFIGDAEDILKDSKDVLGEFDMLFIDASKSHYKAFLDLGMAYLNKGYIICDNVLFGARVASCEYDLGNRHKTNIKNLREFNSYIMNDDRFESSILSIGDGISITRIK